MLLSHIISVTLASGPTFSGIGHMPGGVNISFAHAVSADGTVIAGEGNTPEGRIGFRWTKAGGFEPIGALPGSPAESSFMSGLTPDGGLLVGGARSATHLYEWCTWTPGGGLTAIPPIANPGGYSAAYDVSADGSVAVGRTDEAGTGIELLPAVWRDGVGSEVLAPLPGGARLGNCRAVSDDGSVIVGWFDLSGLRQAFRWTSATGAVALRPSTTEASVANQVTPDGSIIVGYVERNSVREAAMWLNGGTTLEVLGLLPGSVACEASGISADGSTVVGTAELPSGGTVFIWDEMNGMRDLKAVLEAGGLNLTGWTLFGHRGGRPEISADGRVVVGSGDNPMGESEGWIAEFDSACYADCDQSTGVGVLDIFDFLCFQDAFAAGEAYADCDGNGDLDVFDFLCYQDAFVAGCE